MMHGAQEKLRVTKVMHPRQKLSTGGEWKAHRNYSRGVPAGESLGLGKIELFRCVCYSTIKSQDRRHKCNM